MTMAKKVLSFAMACVMALTICFVAVPQNVAEAASSYPGTSGDDCATFYITMEPTGLSTMEATYGEEFKILNNLYTGLTTVGTDDAAAPGIAESWEISDDGLVYTFHLRDDAVWSNGDPVVAGDFAFAWKTVLDPNTGSEYAYFIYQLIAGCEDYYNGECEWEDTGVNVIDDYTLEVTLTAPTAYALDMFNFHTLDPVNESFYNEIGGRENYNMSPEYFCTDGAFTMDTWTHDAEIVMKKDPNYIYADQVSCNTLTYKILTTEDTRLNSFRAGEIDEIDLTGDQLAALQAEGYPIESYVSARDYWIMFNTEDEYMSNTNLRKAIDSCYSRTDFIAAILKDCSEPVNTFCPPSILCNGTSFAEQALELLKEDGYAEDGYLRHPDAQEDEAKAYLQACLDETGWTIDELSAHLDIHCEESSEGQLAAAFFQEAIRNVLGIEVSVTPMMTKAQSAERTAGNYVMDICRWGADYNDPMTFFDLWVTGSGNNSCKFSNEEYDALIADALVNVDQEARVKDFVRCEEIIFDECPISCIYYKGLSYAFSEKITGGYYYTAFNAANFKFVTIG